jgi:hypothetical protein
LFGPDFLPLLPGCAYEYASRASTTAHRRRQVKLLPPGLAGVGGVALAAAGAALLALGPIGIAGAAVLGAGIGIGAGVGGVKIAEDVRKQKEARAVVKEAVKASR